MLCGHNTLPYHADSLVNGVVRLSALTDNIFIKNFNQCTYIDLRLPASRKMFWGL